VTVTDVGVNDLHILVDVSPNYSITRGIHHALTFTLSESDATIVIDNSSPANDFVSLGNGAWNNPMWKGFNYAIDCTATSAPPPETAAAAKHLSSLLSVPAPCCPTPALVLTS